MQYSGLIVLSKPVMAGCKSVWLSAISTGTLNVTGTVVCTGTLKFRTTLKLVPAGRVTSASESMLNVPVEILTCAFGISTALASEMFVVVWTGMDMLNGILDCTGMVVLM